MADKPNSEQLREQMEKRKQDHKEEMRLMEKSISEAQEAEQAEQRRREQAERSQRELEEMQQRHQEG